MSEQWQRELCELLIGCGDTDKMQRVLQGVNGLRDEVERLKKSPGPNGYVRKEMFSQIKDEADSLRAEVGRLKAWFTDRTVHVFRHEGELVAELINDETGKPAYVRAECSELKKAEAPPHFLDLIQTLKTSQQELKFTAEIYRRLLLKSLELGDNYCRDQSWSNHWSTLKGEAKAALEKK